MNLLIIKKWTTKSLLWLKHHWYIPLSVIAILLSYVLFKEKAESLTKAFMDNREGYKKQSKQINEIHDKQISERNQNIANKDKKAKELQKVYEENLRKIDQKKNILVKEMQTKDLAAEFDKEFEL